MKVFVTQACPTLCDPMGCSLPGSSGYGILQQESWSGLPFPSPGDLPKPGVEPAFPAMAGRFFTTEPPGKPHSCLQRVKTSHEGVRLRESCVTLKVAAGILNLLPMSETNCRSSPHKGYIAPQLEMDPRPSGTVSLSWGSIS